MDNVVEDGIIGERYHSALSATTLIINGPEFRGQELSKRPDMIGQSSGHAGFGGATWVGSVLRRVAPDQTEAHANSYRSGEVVEGLKENHTPPHLGAILTEAPTLTHQRRQGLA